MTLTLSLLASAILGSFPQESENPVFKYWTRWKPGAWASYKLTSNQAGVSMEMEARMKLVEVSSEKAVVENSGKMTVNGQAVPTPTNKIDVTAKDDKGLKLDFKGEEPVDVGGKKLTCRWAEMTQEAGGKKMRIKLWMSTDVPGGLVKSETSMDGGPVVMKMTLVEWSPILE